MTAPERQQPWPGPVRQSTADPCTRLPSAPGCGSPAKDQLPHARLHDLRHLHATTLLLSGVPVHVVAARLGHADPAITLRVYAHVIRTAEAAAADIFAEAVKAAA
jgi:integrase